MENRIDERRFAELMEESADRHSDAMHQGRAGLKDYVDVVSDVRADVRADAEREHRRLSPVALAAAGGAGALLFAQAVPAWADSANDVMVLQTAAGIENLAVMVYKTALTLPFVGGSSANLVVKTFAQRTMQQHQDHANAFNAAAQQLGGKPQSGTDPKYTPIVQQAVPTIKGPGDVVGLAITLEDVAAQTYVKDVSLVSTGKLKQLFGSIAGVEAQHKAVLLAVQALLNANAPQLIAIPTDASKLPAAAGSVGFPDAFYPTANALPASEGAVK